MLGLSAIVLSVLGFLLLSFVGRPGSLPGMLVLLALSVGLMVLPWVTIVRLGVGDRWKGGISGAAVAALILLLDQRYVVPAALWLALVVAVLALVQTENETPHGMKLDD